MKGILSLESRLKLAADAVAFLAMAGLLLQSLIILLDVLVRWLLNNPITGLEDVTGLLVIVVVAASMPACLIHRGNITINLLGKAIGPRAELALNAFGSLILLIFIGFLSWQVTDYALDTAEYDETTWILRLPLAPAYFTASAILLVCVPLQLIVTVVEVLKALRPGAAIPE